MADTTIDLLKNSSYVGKMDELIAAVKLGSGAASDVEWDNVKNKPTTIGGYGITDAKIENGTITLGNQTITPLTSAPVTSVNSKTGAVTLSAADVSAIPSTLTGTAGQVLTKTADGQEWKDVDIPTQLPNPNALTFTGAVSGSYDGSAPLSVKIPSGGGSGGFEVLVDFTTEEAVTEFTIPETVITPIISKIKDASILMMQLNIPRDETDTSVTTTGTVTINAYVGWLTPIVGKAFNAIIAPSETYNKNWTKNLIITKAPESVITTTNICLVQIFGKKNSSNPDALDQRTSDNYFNNFYERTYITVVGSQTMAAGTRFVLGVIA